MKEIKLSEKSWHAKLYALMYGEDGGLPKNLCPYFWGVMAALVSVVPFALFFMPTHIFSWVRKLIYKDEANSLFSEGYISTLFFVALVLNAAILVGFSMVYMWFQPFVLVNGQYKFTTFQIIGSLSYLTGVIFGIVTLSKYIQEKARKNKRKNWQDGSYIPKEKTPNILVEFIRAKYKKYCPKINWK